MLYVQCPMCFTIIRLFQLANDPSVVSYYTLRNVGDLFQIYNKSKLVLTEFVKYYSLIIININFQ